MMRGVRPSTSEAAESVVRLHLVAAFGGLQVSEIPRRRVRHVLVSKVRPGGSVRWTDKPLSHGAMKTLRKTLRLIFDAAVFDGHITENPAPGRGVMPRQQSAEDHVDPSSAHGRGADSGQRKPGELGQRASCTPYTKQRGQRLTRPGERPS